MRHRRVMFEHESPFAGRGHGSCARRPLFAAGILAVAFGVAYFPAWVLPGMLAMLFAASTWATSRAWGWARRRVSVGSRPERGLSLDGSLLMARADIAALPVSGAGPCTSSGAASSSASSCVCRAGSIPRRSSTRSRSSRASAALFRVEARGGGSCARTCGSSDRSPASTSRLSGAGGGLIASVASFLYALLWSAEARRRARRDLDRVPGRRTLPPYTSIVSVHRLRDAGGDRHGRGKMRFQIYGTMREVDDAEALASMMERA